MILQSDPRLEKSIREIGCEYLAVLAACEIESYKTADISDANLIWCLLVAQGDASPTRGLDKPESYREAIGICLRELGFPPYCGDMVADVTEVGIRFYSWWKSTAFNYVLERRILPAGGLHTVLLDQTFRQIYSSVPKLHQGVVGSQHLLWIGTRGDWIRQTL